MKTEDFKQMIEQNNKEHQDFRNDIGSLMYAVYGNPETGDMGMKSKVDDMHTLLIQTKGLGRVIKFVLGSIILIGSAITAIVEITKRFK